MLSENVVSSSTGSGLRDSPNPGLRPDSTVWWHGPSWPSPHLAPAHLGSAKGMGVTPAPMSCRATAGCSLPLPACKHLQPWWISLSTSSPCPHGNPLHPSRPCSVRSLRKVSNCSPQWPLLTHPFSKLASQVVPYPQHQTALHSLCFGFPLPLSVPIWLAGVLVFQQGSVLCLLP